MDSTTIIAIVVAVAYRYRRRRRIIEARRRQRRIRLSYKYPYRIDRFSLEAWPPRRARIWLRFTIDEIQRLTIALSLYSVN